MTAPLTVPPPAEYDARLAEAIERIWEEADALGLRPFPTHFEMVPATILYEVGSYLMPGRFSHWTHGKLYHVQKVMYDYGLSRIYELVINTNPCWAFLLESNTLLQNKLVVAHVLGHSDFFANNAYFARTAKRMLDTVTLNAERIRGYEFDHGQREVEKILDAVLAIQFHIDPYSADVDPAAADDDPEPTRSGTEGPYDDLWRHDPALRRAVPPPRRPAAPPSPTATSSASSPTTRPPWRSGSATSSRSCAARASTSTRSSRPRSSTRAGPPSATPRSSAGSGSTTRSTWILRSSTPG